jgi:hypothetical protein
MNQSEVVQCLLIDLLPTQPRTQLCSTPHTHEDLEIDMHNVETIYQSSLPDMPPGVLTLYNTITMNRL